MTRPEKVLKFCPRCGSGLFHTKTNKSFICDSCDFHFFVNSASAVAAVIEDQKGQILLTVRGVEPQIGKLDLPGGFVDPMESAEEALQREIKEELNLEITQSRYLGSCPNEYIYSGYSVFTTDLGYHCEVKTLKTIRANDDIAGYHFYKPEDIDFDKLSSNSIRKILKDYMQSKKTAQK